MFNSNLFTGDTEIILWNTDFLQPVAYSVSVAYTVSLNGIALFSLLSLVDWRKPDV